MENKVLYGTEYGEVCKTSGATLVVNFKEISFELSLEGFMLLNSRLKTSPFVSAGYAPRPSYVVMDIKTTDLKLWLEEEDYYELRDIVEGGISIIGIEESLKNLI